MNEDYKKLSESFYQYLKQLGYVERTCRARQLNVEEFLNAMQLQGIRNIELVQEQHIQKYYEYLNTRPSKLNAGVLQLKTSFDYMKSVMHLFSMLQAQGKINNNPTSKVQVIYPDNEYERTILTQEQIKSLYQHCITARERAILSLSYGCGLRAGELEQVNIEDVRFRDKILIVPKGKGNKRRIVPMSSGASQDLADYYYTERDQWTAQRKYRKSDQAFMLNNIGGRMKEFTYNRNIRIIIDRTQDENIKKKEISVHSLRHSIATHLIEQGMAVEQVRDFLGHSQLETTQVYTHISLNQIKKIIDDP